MKHMIFIFLLFFSALMLFADQVVTTRDGRRAVLRDDSTWFYPKQAQPKQIAHFKDSGINETAPFSVTAEEWLIGWTAEDYLIFSVYFANGEAIGFGMDQDGQMVIRQSGIFYLGIIASADYEIWITELPGLK